MEHEHEPIFEELKNQIEKALDFENNSYWGHGTGSEEIARKIMSEGLVGNHAYALTEMATPLTYNEKSSAENAQHIVSSSMNWPHIRIKIHRVNYYSSRNKPLSDCRS